MVKRRENSRQLRTLSYLHVNGQKVQIFFKIYVLVFVNV